MPNGKKKCINVDGKSYSLSEAYDAFKHHFEEEDRVSKGSLRCKVTLDKRQEYTLSEILDLMVRLTGGPKPKEVEPHDTQGCLINTNPFPITSASRVSA